MTTSVDRPHDRRSTFSGLATFAQRHHWAALVLWVVALVGITTGSAVLGDDYRNDVSLPGTQSQQVTDLFEQRGVQLDTTTTVVLHDERGWDTERGTIEQLVADLSALDHVASVTPPDRSGGSVSEDGTTALVAVTYDAEPGAVSEEDHRTVLDTAKAYDAGQLQVELAGDALREIQEGAGGGAAEGAGMLAALVILVVMFGSLLAAALPLLTAIFAVGTTFGLVVAVSHLVTVPDYTAPILVLVGLGVGIDYALLLFSRYRSELLRGAERPAATRIALDTAGRSVLFAGVSVIIALLGLLVLGVAALQGVVLGVVLTVAMTMLAALTLLPALLTVLGRRLEARILRRAARGRREPGRRWRLWAQVVQRNPWPALGLAVVALVALAAPALGITLGIADAGSDPKGTTTRAAYDLISEKFGPGANGPLVLVTDGSEAQAQAAYRTARAHPGVAAATPPQSVGEDLRLSLVLPETGPQDEATAELVTGLRDDLGEPHLLGGATAANVDFSAAIGDRFVPFVITVVGLSLLLLVGVFRSVPIAIKAAALNLLSIGASLGAMKLVFQDGWLGASAGPIEAFLPVMIFAIVFGLSMDYEVFLLSRMREEWQAHGDPQRAVREGLAHTGGVITAAAAIMIVVFGAFVLSPDRMLQQLGFGMAVAVLLDALVIRCLVVPAVMRLLGARAWWAPAPLRRRLPTVVVDR